MLCYASILYSPVHTAMQNYNNAMCMCDGTELRNMQHEYMNAKLQYISKKLKLGSIVERLLLPA